MRWKTKLLSLLCAAALLLGVGLSGPARAEEITIYLVAENDWFVELPLEAMPTWINGTLYVPYTVFDWSVTGVNLGVSYGQSRTETEYRFTLYSLSGTLVFDLVAGTCTDRFTGEDMGMRAVLRNGYVFLPLAGVCSYFGLNYIYTPTQYGTLIRITNGQEGLDTQQFVTAGTNSMRVRYYRYLQQLNQQAVPQTTPTPTPTPTESPGGGTETPSPTGVPEEPEPEQEGLTVYIAVQCTGGGGLDEILDALENRGIRALFLFEPAALEGYGSQLRRIVGSGHAVGLSVPGSSLEEVRAELRQGVALLEELVKLRPHTVYLEEAGASAADALEAEGWACWSPNVDARPDGRSQSAQSSALLSALERRSSPARLMADDTSDGAGVLTRLLARMGQDNYRFQLALDTRI